LNARTILPLPPHKAMLPSALPPLKSPMSCQTNHREN
jgi:hypothetical protein